MLTVHVHVHVKADQVDEFRAATLENALESRKEPGIARFDLLQELDRPEHFVLVEVYKTASDAAKHKDTAHYAKWRDAVADMMEEPRQSTKYAAIEP